MFLGRLTKYINRGTTVRSIKTSFVYKMSSPCQIGCSEERGSVAVLKVVGERCLMHGGKVVLLGQTGVHKVDEEVVH